MTGEKLSFYIISVCLQLRFFLEINWEPYNEYEITCEKVHFPGARRQIALSSGGGNRQCVCGNHHQHGYIKSYQRSKHEKGAIVDNAYVRLGHYVLLIDQT